MSSPAEEAARRAYWTEQLEAAHKFMHDILDYPVEECGEPFVSLPEAAEREGVEVEFSTLPHVQGLPRLYCLRQGQIESFVGVAREMNGRGWVLKVEDGYRNRQMQKFVGRQPRVFDAILNRVMWELGGKIPDPTLMLRRAMTLTALMPKIGTHMSGSAIDISVLRRDTRQEIDRGGPYLEMSERTPMTSPYVSDQALANRIEITAIFRRHGFVEYAYEFWHYNSGDAYDHYMRRTGTPARYGAVDWNPKTGVITPVPNPKEPLNSPQEYQVEIEAALERLTKPSRATAL